jgi:hypothetical protein
VPAASAVSTPADETVATAPFELIHVPPCDVFVNARVDPTQTGAFPDIAGGGHHVSSVFVATEVAIVVVNAVLDVVAATEVIVR